MTRHTNDLDTTTGLPRKFVGKAVVLVITMLQALGLAGLTWINHRLDDLQDVKVRVARIEGKLNIIADNKPPPVLTVVHRMEPLP